MAEVPVIDEWNGGFGWMAVPDEDEQRASHALVAGNSVWLIDPVDFDGLDDMIAKRGELVGVMVLLDRHQRDSATIATRHGVPVYLPEPLDPLIDQVAADTEPVTGDLADSGYEILPLIDRQFWREAALFDGSTLVVPEALGTTEFFTVGAERLGVHPVLRLTPPRRQLEALRPDRVLVGHGEGVMEDGGTALREALSRSRRTAPRMAAKALRLIVTGG